MYHCKRSSSVSISHPCIDRFSSKHLNNIFIKKKKEEERIHETSIPGQDINFIHFSFPNPGCVRRKKIYLEFKSNQIKRKNQKIYYIWNKKKLQHQPSNIKCVKRKMKRKRKRKKDKTKRSSFIYMGKFQNVAMQSDGME